MSQKNRTLSPPPGWSLSPSTELYNTPYFSLRAHEVTNPRGERSTYYFFASGEWVKVIPITPNEEVIFVRQFRPSVGELTLEIPGGIIDESDQTPVHGARRELLEETGCASPSLVSLGWVYPNPGIQSNRCHLFAALNVGQVSEQRLDKTEFISVERVALAEVPQLIAEGRIVHSLVLAAFTRLALFTGTLQLKTPQDR